MKRTVNGAKWLRIVASGLVTGVSINALLDNTLQLGALAYLAVGIAAVYLLSQTSEPAEEDI